MIQPNYSKICSAFLKSLAGRQKEIVVRRFGLANQKAQRETLEAIGQSQNITRERVRQIENEALLKLKENIKDLKPIFQDFTDYFKKQGGIKKEDLLLEDLGSKEKNQVYFLLNLADRFKRFGESDDFYSFWTVESGAFEKAVKSISAFSGYLEKTKKLASAPKNIIPSYLEISKKIQKTEDGFYGLKFWPEVSPRGVKDKAYIVFKKSQKPLHFTEVASLIGKNALPQTVHNELIKDDRFVLVGRGLYALRDWGYEPGVVKDIIVKVLKISQKPLSKEEVLSAVQKQRLVKENTVFLNLSDRNYFQRNEDGLYFLKTKTA